MLITLNYRLGPLGFFTLENDIAPGNLGIRDQIKALEWIKKNVQAFGGDPDRITISGESAGGMSVMFLMLSPMAEVKYTHF